jgi:hypothetical protein
MVLKMENPRHYLDNISEAASLIRQCIEVDCFKENFKRIVQLMSAIPGHEEMVNVNNLDGLEDWQIKELQSSLLENLHKTKRTTQKFLQTSEF